MPSERENLPDSRAKREIYEFFVLDLGGFFSYVKNLPPNKNPRFDLSEDCVIID